MVTLHPPTLLIQICLVAFPILFNSIEFLHYSSNLNLFFKKTKNLCDAEHSTRGVKGKEEGLRMLVEGLAMGFANKRGPQVIPVNDMQQKDFIQTIQLVIKLCVDTKKSQTAKGLHFFSFFSFLFFSFLSSLLNFINSLPSIIPSFLQPIFHSFIHSFISSISIPPPPEMLHEFRKTAQAVGSSDVVGDMIAHFIALSEEAAHDAQAKIDPEALEAIEDLDGNNDDQTIAEEKSQKDKF